MTASKKSTPPPLSLPPLERPPSKVEAALAAADAEEKAAAAKAEAEASTPEALRERAIEAMVAAGLSREYAEASFELREGIADTDPRAAAEEVAELAGEARAAEDFGAPLCSHGCHGQSWADVPAERDGVGCEHGSFFRKPEAK